MIKQTHQFTNGKGETFTVEIEIDGRALAQNLATKALLNSRTTATAIGGSIIAKITKA